MASERVRLAVLTILVISLLLANSVSAWGANPKPPPCRTAAEFDPANFADPPKIDNQWSPLAPGTQFVLVKEANRGEEHLPDRVVSTVTDLTKVINGVPAVVISETHINTGVLKESKLVFQAQDNVGNLWNLGEFPAEFNEYGKFKEAPNTWISGISDAEPGNLMLGDPQLGTPDYLQGWSPDIDFLVCAKVYKTQQTTCVPVGCYDNVLITEERTPLKPESGRQRKYYAPGVGNIRVGAVGDPEEALALAEISQLSPEDLAKVRQEALTLEKTAYEVSAVYRQTSPTVLTTEPSREPTEPESTGPPEKKPSIKIANAPVGGGQGKGPRACVQLSWLAEEPPDGTTIKLERIYFTWSGENRPINIFEVDPSSCRGVADAPVCAAGQEWKRGGQNSCFVGVNQVVPASRTVTVKLRVTVTCERQADCDNVLKQAKDSPGSQVSVTPARHIGSSSASPSEPTSEPTSETPSEPPSEPTSKAPSKSPSEPAPRSPSESPSDG
jgi:hypothetical protein